MNDYLWRVQTSKGSFLITVVGDWTQEEAAQRLWRVFEEMKLGIIGMIPRKLATGPDDARGTIYQPEEPQPERDFEFLAGRKLWEISGRTAEYEAELIRWKKR